MRLVSLEEVFALRLEFEIWAPLINIIRIIIVISVTAALIITMAIIIVTFAQKCSLKTNKQNCSFVPRKWKNESSKLPFFFVADNQLKQLICNRKNDCSLSLSHETDRTKQIDRMESKRFCQKLIKLIKINRSRSIDNLLWSFFLEKKSQICFSACQNWQSFNWLTL